MTSISVSTASSYDESSTIVSSAFPTLHISSYSLSTSFVPPVTLPRYVNTTISSSPSFESSSVYSSVTSAVTSIDNDREVPTSTTTYLHSKLYSESISTVIQTKSSDWSLSLGNSNKPESASTVSEESLHYLSTQYHHLVNTQFCLQVKRKVMLVPTFQGYLTRRVLKLALALLCHLKME